MIDTVLPALTAAWATMMAAAALFTTALALSQIWDSAIYFSALPAVLGLDM
ncbi:MAG TPA: hypothetical protein VJ770_08075 [Stellaceae bacterium]|jgi:hypothetical protein|nr:hypothetical protein [Stellaceae bacterium]